MIAQLSDEQRQAVLAGTPLEIRDGGQVFYLISKAEYEAARAVLDAEEIEPSFLNSKVTRPRLDRARCAASVRLGVSAFWPKASGRQAADCRSRLQREPLSRPECATQIGGTEKRNPLSSFEIGHPLWPGLARESGPPLSRH